METERLVPPALRERVASSLRPVRPLRKPWQRALGLVPLGLLACLGIPLLIWSLRSDHHALGAGLTWGASLLQVAAGLLLAAAACYEVVPGRAPGRARHAWAAILGLAVALVVTFVTWHVSHRTAPPEHWAAWTRGCFRVSFRNGIPLLLVMLVVAARGYLARPALTGALMGASAGLLADSGWRLVCSVGEPSHVLAGHLAVVPALAALGALLAWSWERIRSRRR